MAETTIVAAALRRPGDRYCFALQRPSRHHDVIQHMVTMGYAEGVISSCEQGFLTADGQFVNRREAKRIAHSAGQLKRETHPTDLFSEDVW